MSLATVTAGASAPASGPRRLAVLAAAVHAEGGEWTTERVRRTYCRAGLDVPKRATARADLHRLTCRGLLELHDTPGRRYWTPTHTTTVKDHA